MKKVTMMAFAGMLACVSAARADFQPATKTIPGGGFVGAKDGVVSVAQAKEMRDDVEVVLKGKIINSLGDEKYTFEDATGTITVEIDKKDWRGQTVTPEDTVKLYGEVDRGVFKTEIDVDYVEKL